MVMTKAIRVRPGAEVAARKARKLEQKEVDFKLCIKHKVCPKCSGDLKATTRSNPEINFIVPPTIDYECTNDECDFVHEETIKQ